jgi:predicted KAP-like P-loop ATPase
LCGFTNPTTSILKLFKNRIVGVHSTTSSIHEMSQFLHNFFNDE